VRRSAEQWLAMLEDSSRRGSWRFRDLKKALESADTREVSQKGSHRTYKHAEYRDLVTLVDNGNDPLPIGYVNDVRRLMRAVVTSEES